MSSGAGVRMRLVALLLLGLALGLSENAFTLRRAMMIPRTKGGGLPRTRGALPLVTHLRLRGGEQFETDGVKAGGVKLDDIDLDGEEWDEEQEVHMPNQDSINYMYGAEVERKEPNVIRPITCEEDIPLGKQHHQDLVNEMTLQATSELQVQNNYLSTAYDISSDTDDPLDAVYPRMSAKDLLPKVTRNMTEDEFYFSRDYRPGRYWPAPTTWTHFQEDEEWSRATGSVRAMPAPDGYSISMKKMPVPRTKGWREREAVALVPWLRRNAVLANLSVCVPCETDVRVPKQEASVRKALKTVRERGGGRIVVRDGDHWPTRVLAVRLRPRGRGKDDDDEDAGAENGGNEGVELWIAGGNGQPRVWGQWDVRGDAGHGGMGGLVCSYVTRASVKPTVLVRGAGSWLMDRCEVRSKGGSGLVATEQCKLVLAQCGVGGLGKDDNRATNAMSVHGASCVSMQAGCLVEWADLGGARFYGESNATVSDLTVRDVGWYGLLVDHNATVRAWNVTFKYVGRGALATSIKSDGCSLFTGNNTIGEGVKEWWGPQRPGILEVLKERPLPPVDFVDTVRFPVQEQVQEKRKALDQK